MFHAFFMRFSHEPCVLRIFLAFRACFVREQRKWLSPGAFIAIGAPPGPSMPFLGKQVCRIDHGVYFGDLCSP